jgi:enoyl-CoA hydratase
MSGRDHPVLLYSDGHVGIIELGRPEIGNGLSTAAYDRILAGLRNFESDGAVRAILICAQGKNFCTGADLTEVRQVCQDATKLRDFIEHGIGVLAALEASDLPVVVAAQGLCLAGGLELLLACDVAFAAESARFGDQHAQFGFIPGWGGTQRLPRAIGLRRALDLLFSARWIESGTAVEWGLVNYVVRDDNLRDSAIGYCRAVAQRSTAGIAAMKRLARIAPAVELSAGLREETRSVVAILRGPDATEGLAAFAERRTPVYSGTGPVAETDLTTTDEDSRC